MGVVWGEHGLENFAVDLYKFGYMVGVYRTDLLNKNNNLEHLYDIGY